MESTIQAAKELAEKLGNDIIVVLAYNSQTGMDTVITWGKELSQSEYAATMGNNLKLSIGWKPEESDAVSEKVQNLIDINKAVLINLEEAKKDSRDWIPGASERDEVFIKWLDSVIRLAKGDLSMMKGDKD